MNITSVPAVNALRAEIDAIGERLAQSHADLAQAEADAAAPAPVLTPICAGKLEAARLSDLAGVTSGACEALQAKQASEAAALAAWKHATATAAQDVLKHRAAVEFHAQALREAERLELAALSVAAVPLVAPAARAYADALAALRTAGAELTALQAVAAAAGVQRQREGTPLEGIFTFDPQTGPMTVPTLHELDGTGDLATPGEYRPAAVHVDAGKLRSMAMTRAHAIADAMRGRG